MKTSLFFICLGLFASASLFGQTAEPAVVFTPDQLSQLAAPIALYPDPLLALILPAAADLPDLTSAGQYLALGGNPNLADNQHWDPRVRALVHYPELISWLNSNLNYTEALGEAFAQNPAGIMQAIQRLRAQALAAGTLVNTPQQVVYTEDDVIYIEPAQANLIYVPSYDPSVVYDTAAVYGVSYVSFGAGFTAGPWLGFGCDWSRGLIRPGPWHARRNHEREGTGSPVRGPDGHPLHSGAPAAVPSLVAAPYQPPHPGDAAHDFAPHSPAPASAAPHLQYYRAETYRPQQASHSEPARSSAPVAQSAPAAHGSSAPAQSSSSSSDNNRH